MRCFLQYHSQIRVVFLEEKGPPLAPQQPLLGRAFGVNKRSYRITFSPTVQPSKERPVTYEYHLLDPRKARLSLLLHLLDGAL
jgi:hypothetical protein